MLENFHFSFWKKKKSNQWKHKADEQDLFHKIKDNKKTKLEFLLKNPTNK